MTKESDYYDKVDEKEHERTAENSSVPDPASRDLWQVAQVGTDGNGPRTEDVSPIFAQARADAFGDPNFADEPAEGDAAEVDTDAEAAKAQEKADAIRDGGYVAPTGEEAGNFDDASLKGTVPAKNLNVDKEAEKNDKANAKSDDKGDESKKSAAKSTAAQKDEAAK